MFKKTIDYTNFNGDQRTKDLYFHLSKGDLTEIVVDGTKERMDAAIASQDKMALMTELRSFVNRAIGARSEDGESFDKSPETVKLLTSSAAYDQLVSELMINEGVATEFITNLVPAELRERLLKDLESAKAKSPLAEPTHINHGGGVVVLDNDSKAPEWLQQRRLPTKQELKGMKRNELQLLFKLRQELAQEQVSEPLWLKENRSPTSREMAVMSEDEMNQLMTAVQSGRIEL